MEESHDSATRALVSAARALVSAIIPVYNGESYLAEAIASIYAQTYRPLELIVVDDGSTDGSAAIAQSFPLARYIYQSNQGHASAKNTGIAKARGEFIAFLDADDVWTPNKLSVQITFLLENPNVAFTLAQQRLFFMPGVEPPSWIKSEFYAQDYPGFLPGTLVARRNVLERIGGFDPSYRHDNDLDWFLRAKDAGWASVILPETLLLRRIHQNNLSHDDRALRTEGLRAFKASVDRQRRLSEKKMA